MTCQTLASTCDGLDVRLIKRFMRHEERPVCAGCRSALDAHGVSYTVLERRAEDRPFKPLWLRHLKARDETGRLVA